MNGGKQLHITADKAESRVILDLFIKNSSKSENDLTRGEKYNNVLILLKIVLDSEFF